MWFFGFLLVVLFVYVLFGPMVVIGMLLVVVGLNYLFWRGFIGSLNTESAPPP